MAGRRTRSVLLVLAVALATVLTVAVAACIGTIARSIDHALGRFAGRADLRLMHRFGGRLDQALLTQARAWPEVALAAGRFDTLGGLALRRTKIEGWGVLVGIEPDTDARLHPVRLLEGRALAGPGEAVIDQITQDFFEARLGDELHVQTPDGMLELKIVGIYRRPSLGGLQQQRVLMALPQVQQLGVSAGQLGRIDLRLRKGVDQEDFAQRYGASLPAAVQFQTAAAVQAKVKQGLGAADLLLFVLTVLASLSAGFLILTSLTTAVTEQMRELAILRCIGASRGQIAGAQLLAGAAVAGVGALVGTPIGLALAYALYWRYRAWLEGGFDPNLGRVMWSILGALLAGLLGAAYPAALAAGVRPLTALTARARPPRARWVVLLLVLGALAAATTPVVLALHLDTEKTLWFYAYLGLPLSFVGYFLLSVPVLVVVARFVAPLLARALGVPATLLRQTVLASPFRHGFTGGALMVGLALVVALWSGGRGIMVGWFGNLVMPDAFAASLWSMSPRQWDALRQVDAVTSACPTGFFPVEPVGVQLGLAEFAPKNTLFVSFDPPSFFRMTQLDWVQGDPATAERRLAEGRALLVSREFHEARGLGVDGKLTLQTARGPVEFTIVGVVGSPGMDVAVHYFGLEHAYGDATLSCIFGTHDDAIRYFEQPDARLALLTLKPDVSDDDAIAQIRSKLPGVLVGSSRLIRREITAIGWRIVRVTSLVALAALALACLGVGNLIIAEVTARRFEYGVLRAIGGGRGLLGRLVAAQTLVVALAGCVLGTVLGMQLSLVDRVFRMRLLGLTYAPNLPWDVIAWGSGAVMLAALLAALPAIGRLLRASPRALLAGGR